MKKIQFHVYICFLTIISLLAFVSAAEAAPTKKAKQVNREVIQIGDFKMNVPPFPGLSRVNLNDPAVKKFLDDREAKLKFKVFAVYAQPSQWDEFVSNLKAGKATELPQFALIGTHNKMGERFYDDAKFRKEKNKVNSGFKFATNTHTFTYVMQGRANKEIKKLISPNFKVGLKPDRHTTARFDESDRSASFSIESDLQFFGGHSNLMLTATMMHMGNKTIYIGYADKIRPDNSYQNIQHRNLVWRSMLGAANDVYFNRIK